MLPTTATALSAAHLAHVFENGANFFMTSIADWKRAHTSIFLRLSLEKVFTKKTLAKGLDQENEPGF